MQIDVLESLSAWPVEALAPGMHFYVREYGWMVVAEADVPPYDDMWGPQLPSTITLVDPVGDDITALRFPPSAQVLAATPREMPSEGPPVEEPVEPPTEPEPPGHFVWRDAGTGEFVDEEYATANPDTTVKEWVLDE